MSRDETEAFAELDRRIEALWGDENRLAVRLGLEDPIFAAFVTGLPRQRG